MSSDLVATLYDEGRFLREWLAALRPPGCSQQSPILPVMLRALSLGHIPLTMRRPVPRSRKAIAGARDRDEVCVEITHLIEQEIETTWACHRLLPPRQETVWFCDACCTMRKVLCTPEHVGGDVLREPEALHREISPTCDAVRVHITPIYGFQSKEDLHDAYLPDWAIETLAAYLGFK
jgi:hypothetical protein